MDSHLFTSYTLQFYSKWNKALFEYFFPKRQEDPLLFVDDTVLEEVGIKTFSNEERDDYSWKHFFLLYVLFDQNQIKDFQEDYHINDGRIASTWNSIVSYLLKEEQQIDGVPSYFAMICAIMYIAQKKGADHSKMKSFAKKYLELDTFIFAERIDDLFTQLHQDLPSFTPNRMLTDTRINIGKIKYHLVLKKKDREDFIDFIEVNNLKWDEGTYKDFADSYLLPALAEAGKNNLIAIIKKEENNPYFKNLLTLPNLKFGKPTTSENVRQERIVYWRYELEFDFNTGEPIFIMTTRDTLCGITFDGKDFKFDSKSFEVAEPLGSNVPLQVVNDLKYSKDNNSYLLQNIANKKTFYFESAARDYFHQVTDVISGKHYLQFVPVKKRGTNECPDGWKVVMNFSVLGYDIYETECYQGKEYSVDIRKDKVSDQYNFYNLGSFCRILLKENEKIYWEPNEIGVKSEQMTTFAGFDGYTYFALPYSSKKQISGAVIVKTADDTHVVLCESIHFEPKWNGITQKYFIDGWGNTTEQQLNPTNIKLGDVSATIQLFGTKTPHANILLDILSELADENGCVNEKSMKNALNFVLKFNGITDPNYNNRKKLIYALRRLGYIVEYYDPSTKKYSNQLVAPFVEKTKYCLTPKSNNLFLIKGVYLDGELQDFRKQNNISREVYKRPYEKRSGNLQNPLGYNAENDSPEYKCLPDLLLFEWNEPEMKKWECLQSPYAYTLFSNIGNMKNFPSIFLSGNGDPYLGDHGSLPEMVFDQYNKEVLCVDKQNQMQTYKVYKEPTTGVFIDIPKHLSRLYCENEKNSPICIINNKDIAFLHKMGIPRVLDMALCDLNLGLPDEHKVFVINHKTSSLPIKKSTKGEEIPYSDIKTYHNFDTTTGWLNKLSARNNNPQYKASTPNSHWKMYFDKEKRHLILTNDERIIAFTYNNKVYFDDITGEGFKEVVSQDNVNNILSKILTLPHSGISTQPSLVTPPSTNGLPTIDII